jgi:CheY-like chemotaxis protein
MSILVVDDESSMREMLAEVLEEEGYRVACAANGLEAITYLRATAAQPCVILLDLMMPVMSGWEFRQEQQHDPVLASIPVVVLSAVQNLAQEAKAIGVTGHLPKPINFNKLLATVQRYCAA